MSFSYLVQTTNHLPHSRTMFQCKCEALKHIKKLIDEYGSGKTNNQIHQSYSLYRIDTAICKDPLRFFKESPPCYVLTKEEDEETE